MPASMQVPQHPIEVIRPSAILGKIATGSNNPEDDILELVAKENPSDFRRVLIGENSLKRLAIAHRFECLGLAFLANVRSDSNDECSQSWYVNFHAVIAKQDAVFPFR